MRRVSIDNLKPGMKVGRAIQNSNGHTLLHAGVILNDKYIARLRLMGIPSLYIDDGFLPDLFVEDVISDQVRIKAIKQVRNTLQKHSHSMGESLAETEKLYGTISEMIDQLLNDPKLIVELTDIRSMDDYVFAHSVNVCVLALMTGISLGYERPKLHHLGMGALLHDIGKILIPKEILNKPGPLTQEEYEIVKKHPEFGQQILNKNSQVSNLSKLVVYQHHERYSGEGYPRGLKDNEIHEFAQITGMVDMYDALTADRVYRKAFLPHEAYEMISGAGDYLFSYHLIEPFLSNIAAYPAGTPVELSSGDIAVVISTKKGFSLYPRVRLLYDKKKCPVTTVTEIDLLDHRSIVISRVLYELDGLIENQEAFNNTER
ncbi:HD-GYP domain-containing protein [Desulforamulus aeronauticus]|uniref:Metal dependent phosphohydrolase n=1 Tax=Desulforamulus aeronauticus DSM 10349 TaxID=1121421 RepID=A0A1M6QUK9_9FIRM|nr:HD-GYP domain-containing protein [Desulforamulus aeronauticus]SHK23855.1 metal dependent phosphohydrolase [Desulforamulus aeronauticus DSM 10349]